MLKRLVIIIASLLLAAPASAQWQFRGGEGYIIGEELRKRLNRYSWDADSFKHSCVWDVVVSYPGFKEPPWENLDLQKHDDLIFRLFKYRACGTKGYFGKGPCVMKLPDEVHRKETLRFIAEGGSIQVWRTRLLSEFEEGRAPPEPQTVVQLRWKWKPDWRRWCSDKPVVDWWRGGLYILKDDLSDPDPRMVSGWASFLQSNTALFFSGKLHYVDASMGEVSLAVDRDGIPSHFCTLEYKDWWKKGK